VINLYQNLTTYEWLAGAGIYPDATKTWTYTQLTSALKTHYGFTPSFDCDNGQVYQVSYYYSLIGKWSYLATALFSHFSINRLGYRRHLPTQGCTICRVLPQHGYPVPTQGIQLDNDNDHFDWPYKHHNLSDLDGYCRAQPSKEYSRRRLYLDLIIK
jgi:hypothetical protein